MNLADLAKTAFVVALFASSAACAAPVDGEQDATEQGDADGEATARTTQAITACAPSITAAAITKQIVSIDQPTTVTVELVTVSPKPYRMNATWMTFPSGFNLRSIATTSCSDMGSSWKCRHTAVTQRTTAMSGTGAYTMWFSSQADAGSGCSSGATQRVDFSLTTEWFGETSIDG